MHNERCTSGSARGHAKPAIVKSPWRAWPTRPYFKIIDWGWYYLSTVLDDCSRLILAWRLCPGMAASDVSATLEDALTFAELNRATVVHRPRLPSDNGPS